MRRLGFMIIILTLVCVFFNNGCDSKGDVARNIVAEYGDEGKITFDELKQYVLEWNYHKKYRVKTEAYKYALDNLIKNQLKRVDFFESHLDTNQAIIGKFNRIINEALVANYFEKVYLSRYINDEFAKRIYDTMDKRVVYQEIVLKKPKSASKSELSEIEQKALEIKTKIENGADFNSMVLEYSQDEQSLQNNGYATPIGWKQSLSDPVGNAIFNLNKNEIRVLSTNIDYKILRVTEINRVHVEPFEKIKEDVINDIKKIYSQRSLDEYEEYKNTLLDTTILSWNETALKKIAEWSNVDWSNVPIAFRKDIYIDTLASAISKSDNKIILTYKDGKVDYKEYIRLLKNILTMNIDRKINEKDIKDLIVDMITTEKIVNEADSLGLRKEIFNAYTKDPEMKDRLVYFYNQVKIEQKIPPLTKENIYNFYNDHKNSIFHQLEKINLYAMVYDNLEDAKEVYKKIKSGTEFEKITGRFYVKTYIKESDGKLKSLIIGQKPIFAEKAFKMKLGEVSEPIQFVDEDGVTKYVVLKCKNIRPEKYLTYEESKRIINEEFRKYYREKLKSENEKQLIEKYHPKYYYDEVNKLISAE